VGPNRQGIPWARARWQGRGWLEIGPADALVAADQGIRWGGRPSALLKEGCESRGDQKAGRYGEGISAVQPKRKNRARALLVAHARRLISESIAIGRAQAVLVDAKQKGELLQTAGGAPEEEHRADSPQSASGPEGQWFPVSKDQHARCAASARVRAARAHRLSWWCQPGWSPLPAGRNKQTGEAQRLGLWVIGKRPSPTLARKLPSEEAEAERSRVAFNHAVAPQQMQERMQASWVWLDLIPKD